MQTVVETPSYLAAARDLGMTDEQRMAIVKAIAQTPDLGDLMQGTGGFRKVRFGFGGKGKSGGVRVVTFFTGPNLPAFLITVFGKAEKANLNRAEQNELSKMADRLKAYGRKGTL